MADKRVIQNYTAVQSTSVDFLPKVKIEVVLDDDQVDEAIEAIIDAAKTDKIGDGKIFVSHIEQAIRIRTRESGSEAL